MAKQFQIVNFSVLKAKKKQTWRNKSHKIIKFIKKTSPYSITRIKKSKAICSQ